MTTFKKHLIIVGTARSGTSWLSEIIARQHRYRLLFEPEHITQTTKGYLICDQWIQDPSEAKKAQNYLKQVFRNRVDNDWIAQNSNRKLKRHLWPWLPKKYIVKFVRTNLSAKYINEEMEVPVLHIIRSPYDVIRSQKRSKFPWILDLSIFSGQENLRQRIKEVYNFDLNQIDQFSEIELMTIRWCIENVFTIEHLNGYQGKSKVVKYEDVISNIELFKDICQYFGLEPVKNIESIYSSPSSKTHPNSDIRMGNQQKKSLTNDEILKMNKILDLFKCSLYDRIQPV